MARHNATVRVVVAVAALATMCLTGLSGTIGRPGVPSGDAAASVAVPACLTFCTADSSWGGRMYGGSNG